MNVLDDDLLSRLLHEAARNLAPDDAAPARILDAAAAPHRGDHAIAAAGDVARARPGGIALLTVAAVVALVTGIVLVSLSASGAFAPRQSPVNLALGSHEVDGIRSPTVLHQGQNLDFGVAVPIAGDQKGARRDTANSSNSSGTPAKVVATGSVALRVGSGRVHPVLASLTALAGHLGGYVASSNVKGASSTVVPARATIILRVPEHNFGALVTSVERDGVVTSVVTNSTDVTGQFVDYQARIAAAEASRTQYLQIMAKASTISAILSIQAQIDQIQTQIEQLEGARNVLVNQAAYGTLTVQLNQSPLKAHESGVRRAVHNSVAGFVAAVEGLITAIGPALFALLCLAVLLVVGRLAWRLGRRRLL